MTINGRYYTEPEALAYISALEKRNAELVDLTCGWMDAYKDLILGYKKGRCAICKHSESTGLIGKCKECHDYSKWVWRYAEKYGIETETNSY